MSNHVVRIGVLGQVGRFASADGRTYRRGCRVICRTERGLEAGEVLSAASGELPAELLDGSLLRQVTPEDELILARIEKNRQRAYRACCALLAERGLSAVLLEVEHLFDGQGLYFYFLGEVPPEIETLTTQLAEAYEAKVQFRRFTQTLAEGCGPDCGTHSASGPGCGSACGSCAIAGACSTGG